MSDELDDLRDDVIEARGEVTLQLGTDFEWTTDLGEFTADADGQTFRGLLRTTGAAEKIEQMKARQEEKGKTIEGIVVHIKSAGPGRPRKFDSLTAAYDYVCQPGDVYKVTFKIGTNWC